MATRTIINSIALLAAIAGSGIVHGATVRVDKWGEDTPDCGSKPSPCASIQYAITQRSGPNDRVLVGPGYYEENVVIHQNAGGQDLEGLKLESTNGMHATVIRTTLVNTHGIDIRQSRVRIGKRGKGFTVGGADSAGYGAIVVTVAGTEKIRVEGNRAILSFWGIYLSGERVQARYNVAELNDNVGIGCEHCDDGIFRDNLARDNGSDGYEIANSDRLVFQRNVSAYNSSAGFLLDNNSEFARLKDNVSEFNDDNGFTLLDADGSNSQGNVALLNHNYGFDFDQVDTFQAPVIRHNLAVFNDFSGFFLDDLVAARVDSNTAVSNDIGFTLTPTTDVETFRRNNSFASGAGCGIENNSGTTLRPDGHYYGDPTGLDPVLDLDDHDGVCGGSLVGDDFRAKVNPTRTRVAEKL